MRLHTLRFTAFGPFPGTEFIDFDALSQDGLFLLHGRTGSGKTFILDAVTFALYGQVAGQRGVTRLRSDHAAPMDIPQVVLEFTLSDRRYRITRSPQHVRPKQRGSGHIQENQKAHLEVWDGGSWRAAADGPQAVGKELGEILPLDRQQFTKVILLPQGDFAEFLRSNSKEKQELLERLFDTGRFALLQQQLRTEAKAAAEQVDEVNRTIELHYAAVQDAAAQMFGQDWRTEAPRADEPDEPTVPGEPGEPEQAMADDAMAQGERLAARLAERLETLSEQHRSGQQRAETLRRRRTALIRWEEHLRRRQEHEDQRSEADQARIAVQQHDEAEGLRSWFHAASAAQQETEQLNVEALRAVEAARRAAAEQQDISAQGLVSLSTDISGVQGQDGQPAAQDGQALEEAIRELTELQGRLTAQDAAALEQEQQSLSARRRRYDQDREKLEEQEAAAGRRVEELVTEVTILEESLSDTEALEAQGEQLRARREELRGRTGRIDLLERLYADHRQEQEELNTRREQAEEDSGAHRELLRQHLRGVAYRLAGELEEGVPCLVCGSAEHPAPAGLDENTVTEDQVEEALRRSRHSAEGRAAAEATLRNVRDRITEAAESLEEDAEQLREPSDAATAHLAALRKKTESAWQEAEDRLRETEQQRATQRRTSERLETLRTERASAEKKLAETRHRLQMVEAEQRRVAEDAGRLERTLTGLRGPHDSITERLSALGQLERTLLAGRDSLRRASVGEERALRAQQEAAEHLEDSRFSGRAEAEGALLEAPAVTEHRARVKAWETAAERLRWESEQDDVIDGQRRQETGEVLPQEDDVRAAEDLVATLAARLAEERREVDRFTDRLSGLKGQVNRLTSALRLRREHLAAQLRRAELAATVNGEGPDNTRRMTLTTYVLAARLERVAQAATRHLQTMSEGRYRLLHDDEASGRGLQGLDLKVHDEHSDDERSTSSLSGGETFMASLAMALGLAEVVQSDAGGIGLESLFIDEGFGSLDEETLEHVMVALTRLQGEGRRVGVVSHVTEMHRAIPVQLMVCRGSQGSTTRTILPYDPPAQELRVGASG